jgi:hypothetical protein
MMNFKRCGRNWLDPDAQLYRRLKKGENNKKMKEKHKNEEKQGKK